MAELWHLLGGTRFLLSASLVLALTNSQPLRAAEAANSDNPADQLPPYIRRVTWFGERADWSHDGRRILFVEKTFGDVYEVELDNGRIRPLTHHFRHCGFTRALYLANEDVLLSGPAQIDPLRPGNARVQCDLSVLSRTRRSPPTPLGTRCSEGPAVSRSKLHIAWTHVSAQYPAELSPGASRILEANLRYENDVPRLDQTRVVLQSTNLPFQCTLESQNFRPPAEDELTFSAYGYSSTEVFGIQLRMGKITNYSNAPGQYDEPEGIFPDGQFTLVECDRPEHRGWQFIDLWKLRLDGSGKLERLTQFSKSPGFKASNGVVSDDGRFLAFQLARSTDDAGVGYGIFVQDLQATPASNSSP